MPHRHGIILESGRRRRNAGSSQSRKSTGSDQRKQQGPPRLRFKRKEILLGTNQYPNFNEKAGEKAPVEAKCCCGGNHDNCEKPFATLNFDRAASQFEVLRLQTEKSGKRPKAFMLTIGNLAMRQARAQFSCNFLACAGYEVIDNLGFPQ